MILDNHPMVARALAMALGRNDDIEVIGSASTVVEGVGLAAEFHPDVVIVEDPLPDGTAVDATEALRRTSPKVAVLVVRPHVTEGLASRSLAAGALGVLDRSAEFAELEHAVRACARGQTVVERRLLPAVLPRLRSSRNTHGNRLTSRELEVLGLLDAGLDAAAIARRLVISRNTARNYVQRVIVKLGAHSKGEAVAMARRKGLLRG